MNEDIYAENMMIRVAWYYYKDNLTQNEIANLLDISRAKVVRLLGKSKGGRNRPVSYKRTRPELPGDRRGIQACLRYKGRLYHSITAYKEKEISTLYPGRLHNICKTNCRRMTSSVSDGEEPSAKLWISFPWNPAGIFLSSP